MRTVLAAAIAATLTMIARPPGGAAAGASISLGYETGPAYVAQNDGRYGVDGTPYEAADVGQQKTLAVVQRTYLEARTGRHAFILLYAPFQLDTRVTLAEDLRFRSTRFPAGTVVDHRYVFDGFRGSYLYRLLPDPLRLEVGASLQVRSADVAFTSVDGALHADQDDIGLVGAAKARLTYAPAGSTWAALEADALSTFGLVGNVKGAIYDVALSVGTEVRPGVDVYLTTRLLGGGADVPDKAIYNWANFVSATAGIRVTLDRVGR